MIENTTYVTLSRQVALQRELGVIANNIANVNTTAFKQGNMMFQEYLSEPKNSDSPISFVLDVATARDFTQGQAVPTGNPLNLMISGDGFFPVDSGDNILYTRNGNFQIDSAGQLTNSQGMPLLGDGNQPIVVNQDDPTITISKDGIVSDSAGEIGRITVMKFDNNQTLTALNSGLFSTEQQPVPADEAEVVQGMLESSNVNAVHELTRMIELSRSYSSTQNMLQADSEMRRTIIRRLGRVALV